VRLGPHAIVFPSRDHAAPCSSARDAINGLRWEPSAFITQISQPVGPNVFRSNAIFLASGDQAGYSPLTRLTRLCLEPSAFITQMLGIGPPRTEANAILLPSGDQAGEWSCPGRLVRLRFCDPFAFIT